MNRIISLFLFIFIASCLNAQYNSPIKNKVTLGKQTTADGLVFRGVANDTNVITPFSDTSAYIILDTVNSKFYHYNRTTTFWSLAGGGVSVSSFNAGTTGLTPSTATTGAVTLGGTLSVANGGTGSNSFESGNIPFSNGTLLTSDTSLYWDNTNKRLGIGTKTPNNPLSVKGRITMFGGNDAFYFSSNGIAEDKWHIGVGGTVPSTFVSITESNVAARLRIIAGGNVGIGTTTPLARLHVKGSANASEFALKVDDSGSNTLLSVQNNGAATFSGALSGTSATFTTSDVNVLNIAPTIGTAQSRARITNTSGDIYFGIASNTGVSAITGTTAYSGYIATADNAKDFFIGTNGVQRFKLDGSTGAATFSSSVTANSLSLTTPLSVANGGTGKSALTANKVLVGNGTDTIISPTNLHWRRYSANREGLGIGTGANTDPAGSDRYHLSIMGGNYVGAYGLLNLMSPSVDAENQAYGVLAFVDQSLSNIAAWMISRRGPGIYSGNYEFATSPGTSPSNIIRRMQIKHDGKIGIGLIDATEILDVDGNARIRGNISVGSATPTTSGTGITFPATQSASINANTLDDYEEGTWTPSYEGILGSAGSRAYEDGFPRGRYTRIGRFIHASGEITLKNKGLWTSGVVIEGLPYTTTAEEGAFGFIILGFVDFAADVKYCQFRGTGGANNRAYIDTIKDNLVREILLTSAINNNSTFEFSFIYTTSN